MIRDWAWAAMLDKPDRRGNRASLGHIIGVLNEDEEAADFLSTPHVSRTAKPIWQKLRDARDGYEKILAGPVFERVQRLRNDEIGHLLVQRETVADSRICGYFCSNR